MRYDLDEIRSRRTVLRRYGLEDDQSNIIIDKASTPPASPSYESSNILLAGVLSL